MLPVRHVSKGSHRLAMLVGGTAHHLWRRNLPILFGVTEDHEVSDTFLHRALEERTSRVELSLAARLLNRL